MVCLLIKRKGLVQLNSLEMGLNCCTSSLKVTSLIFFQPDLQRTSVSSTKQASSA
nr:MAG TPA: hypothetical protein [Caudoviricetes sp.]